MSRNKIRIKKGIDKSMYKTTLKIDDMMCAMCEAHINDVIRNVVSDAKKVKSSFKKGECSFISDTPPDGQALLDAIKETGYEVKSIESAPIEKKGLFGR